jgi:tetratricopeptide (TPR) repeat protein
MMPNTSNRWTAAALGTVALLLLAACGGPQARYADHLAKGERLLAAGKLDKAGIEFRNAIQVAPNAARARYLAGRVALLRGDNRTAFARFQEAIELDPKDPAARASLGRLFLAAGLADKAVETISPALLANPDSAPLLVVRAAARSRLEDPSGALADAQRAAALAPEDDEAVSLLAAVLYSRKETPKAHALVTAAVAARPTSVRLNEMLAEFDLNAEDRESAEADLRRLVRLQPRLPQPSYRLALMLARFGRLDAAQKVLEEAVERLPDDPNVKLVLTDFLATQRSRAEGETTLRNYIARDPDDLELRLGLGALLERSNAIVESMAVYRDIIERNSRSPKALVARDRIATREVSEGQFDAAEKLIAEVIAQNPQDTDALTLRGNIALERGQPSAAVADLRAVLREQPGAVPVRRMLARAYVALDEPQLAEEALRSGVTVNPGDVGIRIDLAELLGQTGRLDAAVALLEDGLRKSPQSGPVREALVRAYLGQRMFATAESAARDLITLQPRSPTGAYLAGVAALEQRKPDDADRYLTQALALDPTSVDILTAFAQLDRGRGRAVRALARVRATSDAYPKSAAVRNLLGEMLAADRQDAAAVGAFKVATALAPKWWLPWRNLATVHSRSGDMRSAIADDEAGLEAVPDQPVLASQLALFYEESERVDDAIRVYESLLAAHPRLALAQNNLAMLLVTHRTDPASLSRAAALTTEFAKSANPAFLDTYGWVLYKAGKYSEAMTSFEQAVAKARDSDVIRYHLGMAELKLGEPDKARADLQAALTHSDRFTGAAEARTVLASLQAPEITPTRR